MMMAMCSGIAVPPPVASAVLRSIALIRAARPFSSILDLGDLFFLRRQKLVDLGNRLIGRFLHGIGIAAFIVFGDVAVLLQLFQKVEPVAPDMPHCDARLLGIF